MLSASSSGFDKRLRDSVRRRRRVLPRVERHGVRGQRGECSPLDTTVGADHAQKHPRYQKPSRDPQ